MNAKVNSRDEDLIRNHMVRNHANFHSLNEFYEFLGLETNELMEEWE